jgi:hypothetical protein
MDYVIGGVVTIVAFCVICLIVDFIKGLKEWLAEGGMGCVVIIVIIVIAFLAIRGTLKIDYIIISAIAFVAFIAICLIVDVIIKHKRRKLSPASPPSEAPAPPQANKRLSERTKNDNGRDERAMAGAKYERVVGRLFRDKYGYETNERGGKDDNGIDIVGAKGDRTLLIQCKYWMNPEGRRDNGKAMVFDQHDMRELYGDCARYINENGLNNKDVTGVLIIPTKKCVDLTSILPYLNAIRNNKENIYLKYVFITKDGEEIE